jgi:putative membrane protein
VTAEGGVPPGSTTWRRLHPLTPVLRSVRALVALAVLGGEQSLASHGAGTSRLIYLALAVIATGLGTVTWLVTRWRLEGPTLRIDSGLLRRRSRRFPLARLQAVDVVRPLLGRFLGLAELRLRVAGAGRSGARLAYLSEDEVEPLRRHLLAVGAAAAAGSSPGVVPGVVPGFAPGVAPPAAGSAALAAPAALAVPAALAALAGTGGAPSGVPATWSEQPFPAAAPGWTSPARPLFAVPPGRLLASIALSGGFVFMAGVVVALVALAVTEPRAAAAAAGVLAASSIGLARIGWARLSVEWGFRVEETPDGLLLQCGLLNTRTETIPRGRVQALRIVEPLLWRPLGWCRVEVDVAGEGGRRRGGDEGSRVTSALLPVGSRAAAVALVDWVLPGDRPRPLRAPARTRWKAPLRYHHLAAGHSPDYVLTGSGRLCRVTDLVPLAKVQSLRWVQGPVQRRLRLASVHVDVAGRSVYAQMRDRDAAEADLLVRDLPGLCRAARKR